MASPIEIQVLFARDADASYRVEEHVHYGHQWYCMVRGDVETTLDGVPMRLGDGQSVIVPPGMRRAPRCVGRAPRYVVCVFDNRALDLDGVTAARLDTPASLEPELEALVGELLAPAGSDTPFLLEALVVRLLVGLRRTKLGLGSNEASRSGEVTQRVDAFLAANLHLPLTRRDVARAVHVSEPHLARTYREGTGKTLGRRLAQMRMERARALLAGSTMSVAEIAGEVGYASFSHFSKAFREAHRMAPREFRKRYGVP